MKLITLGLIHSIGTMEAALIARAHVHGVLLVADERPRTTEKIFNDMAKIDFSAFTATPKKYAPCIENDIKSYCQSPTWRDRQKKKDEKSEKKY